ncbi:Nuclear control of ATPase protein 2 [Rhizophlyctis rosea]|uniref:Nuclear control of ATPase protein 2 n=1 Tax=Rhizophlyctis rosea TaxID=64517 RepID=A0AAD5X295_9FUNG|nr:Nuclear control of ATPase protein 2 [Rhizophlyctis rosea]
MGYVRERLLHQLVQVDAACGFSRTDVDPVTAFDNLLGRTSTDASIPQQQEPSILALWDSLQSPIYQSASKDLGPADRATFEAEVDDDRNLPNVDEIRTQLKDVFRNLYQLDLDGMSHKTQLSTLSPIYPLAELALLSKAAAAIQAHLMQHLLTASTNLSPAISYWVEHEVSDLKSFYYFVQTLPSRGFHYAKFCWQFAKENTSSDIRPQFRLFYEKLTLGRPFSAAGRDRFKSPLKSLGLSLRAPPTIFELARREIALKRTKLEEAKQLQTACLGLLAAEGSINGWKGRISTADQRILEEDAENIRRNLIRSLKISLGIMDALQSPEADRKTLESATFAEKLHASATNFDSLSIPEIYTKTYDMSSRITTVDAHLNGVRQSYGPPSRAVRYWFPIVASTLITYQLGSSLAIRWNDLVNWANNVRDTARDFALEWVVKPLQQVYATVRHRESRLALLGSESLSSDLESLERMVLEFARDHGVKDAAALSELSKQVERGDLSIVLQTYEGELKSPLKNVISGDLVRSFLIQIQKTKVDLELAMSALDKLLRSNELNFAMLAVIPTLVVVAFLTRQLRSLLNETKGMRRRNTYDMIRNSLREIERVLNRCDRSGHPPLPFKDRGLLLCELHLLRRCVPMLPQEKNYRTMFVQDLRELEGRDSVYTIRQRLGVVRRIWRTYPFCRIEPL